MRDGATPDRIVIFRPFHGGLVNAEKTWLLVRGELWQGPSSKGVPFQEQKKHLRQLLGCHNFQWKSKLFTCFFHWLHSLFSVVRYDWLKKMSSHIWRKESSSQSPRFNGSFGYSMLVLWKVFSLHENTKTRKLVINFWLPLLVFHKPFCIQQKPQENNKGWVPDKRNSAMTCQISIWKKNICADPIEHCLRKKD